MDPSAHAPHAPTMGPMHGTYLARVVSVQDPDGLTRVQVRLLNVPAATSDADCAVWARVAVPFAGASYGMMYLPNVGEEVAVVFAGGDPRQPLVLGSLWNGASHAPETLGGDRVDRYVVKTKKGSTISIEESTDGQATLNLKTPGTSVSVVLNQQGSITLTAGDNKITMNQSGVTVVADQSVSVTASQVKVTAPQVTVNAATSTFSGMVVCDTLQATTVSATTYTPGAGNVW
jgi:uncharacterized protein involved in type VI secretion and phage assembly